jgi:hypothetical protein
MNFIDHFHSFSHFAAYLIMLLFVAVYWKHQIWPAIKGFNGKLQLIEMLKFGAIIGYFSYMIEIIFGEKQFDIYFGSLLLMTAIAAHNSKIDLGNILSKMRNTDYKEEKQTNKNEEEH